MDQGDTAIKAPTTPAKPSAPWSRAARSTLEALLVIAITGAAAVLIGLLPRF